MSFESPRNSSPPPSQPSPATGEGGMFLPLLVPPQGHPIVYVGLMGNPQRSMLAADNAATG